MEFELSYHNVPSEIPVGAVSLIVALPYLWITPSSMSSVVKFTWPWKPFIELTAPVDVTADGIQLEPSYFKNWPFVALPTATLLISLSAFIVPPPPPVSSAGAHEEPLYFNTWPEVTPEVDTS